MRKLKLSIDTLAVQSFDTAPLVRGRGTVHGQGILVGDGAEPIQPATHPDCPSPVCMDTPLASCDGTCGRPGCDAYEVPA
jgi:hypothetical protein